MIPVLPAADATWDPTYALEGSSVVLVDDDPDFRWVTRRALERTGRYTVVGEAADGASGVELVLDHAPDLVLLDIDMPVMDGLEALSLIGRHSPATQVVMLTATVATAQLDSALARGAVGIIRKGSSLASIVNQLRGLVEPGAHQDILIEGVS